MTGDPVDSSSSAQAARCRGMSPWRWLLFELMARFDRQEIYLRLPNAIVTTDTSATCVAAVAAPWRRPGINKA